MAEPEVWRVVATLLLGTFLLGGIALLKSLHRPLTSLAEWGAWLVVSAVALWMTRNYFHDGLIGAGDSYHYTLQVADFITQMRKGIFPVMIGQSEYAFNGNIHTVRTAPYFTSLAGLLDCITAQKLSFVLLKNVMVILSAWGGALAAYASARVLAPENRLGAIFIAILYVSAPGILTPVMSLDMYATFMTVPFLPLFFLGVTLSLQRLDDSRPLLLSVGSLALIWYGHPPIAAWLTPLLLIAQGARLFLVGSAPGNFFRPIGAALLFALLTGYLFYSVQSLHLPDSPTRAIATRAGIIVNVRESWPAVVLPLGASPQSQLQLGYALWACILICGLKLPSARLSGWFLGITILGFAVLVLPLPGVTNWIWSYVPAAVINLTNNWPGQRFYPLLSATAIVWSALSLRTFASGPSRPWLFLLLLGVACLSSLGQNRELQKHNRTMIVPNDIASVWFDPENLTLTRSSYLLFNEHPGYYSDSWVDPEFESRLLSKEFDVTLSNSGALLATNAAALAQAPIVDLKSPKNLNFDRNKNWLLVFNFPAAPATGEIAFTGAVRRSFALPESGGELAFGSSPKASHTLTLRAKPGAPSALTLVSTVPGVSVKSIAFEDQALPVQLKGLTPFRAQARSTTAGYLETPAVFVPGYAASVNGKPEEPQRSYQGLVAIPIPAGVSTVEVTYPGPPGLRASWFVALTGFISLPLLWRVSSKTSSKPLDAAAIRRYHLFVIHRRFTRKNLFALVAVSASLILVVASAVAWNSMRQRQRSFGSLRLTLRLPPWTAHHAEPVVITGHQGSADCVYLVYEDPSHVRLGFDHWGKGGPISEPFIVQHGPAQIVEVTMGSLYPSSNPQFSAIEKHWKSATEAPLVITYNGKEVLRGDAAFHPAPPRELSIGENNVETSTCDRRFTGQVIKVERFIPQFLRDESVGPAR